jgi:4'-phosphopantetheinyl transferase
MNNDPTYEQIRQSLAEASEEFAFAYAVVDMREMMPYIHGDGDGSIPGSVLSFVEKERFDKYTLPKKKLQWLAGRFAVKTALMKYQGRCGGDLAMTAVDVLNDENSAPYMVQFPDIRVSITHSFPYCIGLVANHRIGIDLEKMMTPRKAMFDLFFHSNEIQSLPEDTDTDEYKAQVMIYWTRKEALSKLLGLGMKMGFKRMDTTGDRLVLPDYGGLRVRMKSSICRDFCCSIAVEEQAVEAPK